MDIQLCSPYHFIESNTFSNIASLVLQLASISEHVIVKVPLPPPPKKKTQKKFKIMKKKFNYYT